MSAAGAPRLVILAGPFPTHTAFVRRVAAAVPVVAAVRETRFLPESTLASRAAARAASVGMNPIAMAREAMAWRQRRRRERSLDGQPSEPGVDEYPIHDLNTDAGVAMLESLAPDYLAVCGTGLLQPRVFEIARRGTFNIHLGLSPRYRGSHCIFWPLYNGEPEWIGITIHQLNRGIDAGPIFAQRRPSLDARDDVDSLIHKSFDLAIDAMADVLRRVIAGPLHGVPQQLAEGRNYKARDMTGEKQRELAARLDGGYLRDYLARHGGRVPEVPLINV